MLICSLYFSIYFAVTLGLTNLKNAIQGKFSHSSERYLVSFNRNRSNSLEEFKAHLESKGINHEILIDLTNLVPEVFCGVSVQIFEEDLKHLESFAHVEQISRIGKVSRPRSLQERRLDGPTNSASLQYPPHIQTRISKLHEMGIAGQGVNVALIDTGIDCTHPAFGNGFGPGFKIGFGRSFVNDDGSPISPSESEAPRSPCTRCGAHGSSTAGILAASDTGYGFTGVAPSINLGMYLVGCDEDVGAHDDVIIAAMLQAQKDAADIISISLGSGGGWGEGRELSRVANKLVQEKGVIMVASAGNSGHNGLFLGESISSSKNVIAVGSVDSQATVARNFKTSTGKNLTLYRPTAMDLPGEYPVYLTFNPTEGIMDACNKLPENTPNLKDYIVLIKNATNCLLFDQTKNAVAKGAKQILFYLGDSTTIPDLHTKMLNATISAIPMEDGNYIFDQAKKDPAGFKVSFPLTPYFYVRNLDGGLPSKYSTYGPSFDLESPQPAVAGVGGIVATTLPIQYGSYGLVTGTSMAAPQIAGIIALILSARGKGFNGPTMRSRLSTNAKVLNSPITSMGLDSVVHQGGGLIDAFCAVWTNTTISVPGLVLNDSISFKPNQGFTISNNGTSFVDYVLSHRPAVTLQTFSPDSKYGRPDLKPTPSNLSATAEIYPRQFRLSPGSSQSIEVKFLPPESLDPRWLAVYSGYIVMDSNVECESHNLPYYGVAGSLKEQSVIDRGPNQGNLTNYPYLTFKASDSGLHGNNTTLSVGKLTPLNGAFVWNLKEHNSTFLNFRLLFGSPLLRFDVLPGNTILSNDMDDMDVERSFRGTRLVGTIPVEGPNENICWGRSSYDHESRSWNGTIITQDKTTAQLLPNGNYRLLFRALRVTGTKENPDDYDHWISPEFKFINSQG
ncbi:hypothetical protein PGT21_037161 [Puccinia graminis f. sp. tritici]|uniref:Uncharacterized protein n=1 Tax=Puccinia graminis f. sp. tritici TaxID=56615 RepID=A0A5B0R3J5_PUCGR|nr:hypothetical protein PGT21_037161 [Puccinia graminis f. sp. tritici]